MDFHILVAGLNHRTADVDVREKYALAERPAPLLWQDSDIAGIRESFSLSTCNRVELLAVTDWDVSDEILAHWAGCRNGSLEELSRYAYLHNDLDAVRHVFEVASSLDSMVLGEPQILGQFKAAYRQGVENRGTGPILNRLMHRAFFVAKRVRHETSIAASAVSISYAAVELAKRIFGSMPAHRAMLIGAGEMAELAAMHLLQAGIDEILVINRTLAHGEALAAKFRGRALPFAELGASLAEVDIVIASTGSSDAVLNAGHVKKAMKARRNRPMFFIDIAVPRDIDPDVNEIDNVYLYDIDDLRDVVEENIAGRREEAERAKLIIGEEVAEFSRWLDTLEVTPTILQLIQRGDRIAKAELARAVKRAGPLAPEVRSAMEALARGIVKKMNHEPLMFLKKDGMGRDNPHGRIDTVRRIYNLDACGKESGE